MSQTYDNVYHLFFPDSSETDPWCTRHLTKPQIPKLNAPSIKEERPINKRPEPGVKSDHGKKLI